MAFDFSQIFSNVGNNLSNLGNNLTHPFANIGMNNMLYPMFHGNPAQANGSDPWAGLRAAAPATAANGQSPLHNTFAALGSMAPHAAPMAAPPVTMGAGQNGGGLSAAVAQLLQQRGY